MHYKVYDVLYSQFSNQYVSSAIAVIFKVISILQDYICTPVVWRNFMYIFLLRMLFIFSGNILRLFLQFISQILIIYINSLFKRLIKGSPERKEQRSIHQIDLHNNRETYSYIDHMNTNEMQFFILLYLVLELYMFRTPFASIIRSTINCNSSHTRIFIYDARFSCMQDS
jgi:hypothetical protein